MHRKKINDYEVRTDLIVEYCLSKKNHNKCKYKDIEVTSSRFNRHNYTTIYFQDITDTTSYNYLRDVLKKELKKYIKVNKDDVILVIGLGNEKSTPDALGPLSIDNILPTRYLFNLGDVEEGYSNVSVYKPNVMGNTGIESINIIKSIIKDIKATKVIVIDALKASNLDRLVKTIQITNRGINPGSGVNNNRGEISRKTLKTEVIAIGIPTVVDIMSLLQEKTNESFIVTPTNIDFLIERLSKLLGESVNKTLHSALNRQITK